MLTLKLYRNGPLAPEEHTTVMEVAAAWLNRRENGILQVTTFKKKVGVDDEDGSPVFYVGGPIRPSYLDPNYPAQDDLPRVITAQNYYDWGVIENANGRTTEMLK